MGRVTSEDANGVWRWGTIRLWFQECIHNRQALGTRPADDKNKLGHNWFCKLLESFVVLELASSIDSFIPFEFRRCRTPYL